MRGLFNWLKGKESSKRSPEERSQRALDILAWQQVDEEMALQDQLRAERLAATTPKTTQTNTEPNVPAEAPASLTAQKPVQGMKTVRFKARTLSAPR